MDVIVKALAALTRQMTMIRRRHSKWRHLVPTKLVRQLNKGKSYLTQLRHLYIPVHERSFLNNIYHCCTHKSGSQWIKSTLTDPMTFQYCGLAHYHYQSRQLKEPDLRKLTERISEKQFPERTIVSPLYVSYENYKSIPKSGAHRAFFVMRDPRDLVVSWYFSTRYSHILDNDSAHPMALARKTLNSSSVKEGMLYGIDYWYEQGRFAALDSWTTASQNDKNVLIIRYEDLISSNNFHVFRELFNFLDIRMPDEILEKMINAYSFERLTGRKRGDELQTSHLRKASSGDWKNYFDETIESRLEQLSDNLVERLGYR